MAKPHSFSSAPFVQNKQPNWQWWQQGGFVITAVTGFKLLLLLAAIIQFALIRLIRIRSRFAIQLLNCKMKQSSAQLINTRVVYAVTDNTLSKAWNNNQSPFQSNWNGAILGLTRGIITVPDFKRSWILNYETLKRKRGIVLLTAPIHHLLALANKLRQLWWHYD